MKNSPQVTIKTKLLSLLKGKTPKPQLPQILSLLFHFNLHHHNLIATKLIGLYPPHSALKVLNTLRNPNLFPFNAAIRVLAESKRSNFDACFELFKRLKRLGLWPNDLSFSFMLKACFGAANVGCVEQIHGHVVKSGFGGNPFVCRGLIGVYGVGFRDVISSRKLFDEMPDRGFVSCWSSLVSGLAKAGCVEEVLDVFCLMVKENLKPENDAMVSVLSACSSLDTGLIEKWVLNLCEAVDDNSICADPVDIVLVYLLGKCGKLEEARNKFDKISENGKRNVLPWNAMLNSYVKNGIPFETLSLFHKMIENPDPRPNHVTMVSVLSACAQVGDLDLGRWVHEYIVSQGRGGVLQSNTFLATALIDMYTKCGNLDKAREVFMQIVSKDVVLFNAMIMGFAVNGEGLEALKLFHDMAKIGINPNGGTFLSLIWACSHSRLLKEGKQIFQQMASRFNVRPKLEHYACYIDLLAREGNIEEALEVSTSMPFNANEFVWGALLGGCLLHSKATLAQDIYERLILEDPNSSGGYVMLANTFAMDRRWGDVLCLRWFMRGKGVKKQPGCSWISIDGLVHEFVATLPLHPQIDSVYSTLDALVHVMKMASP